MHRTASIKDGSAPIVASFSSRGPISAVPNILKLLTCLFIRNYIVFPLLVLELICAYGLVEPMDAHMYPQKNNVLNR